MTKNPLLLAVYLGTHLAYMVIVPLFIFGGLGLALDHAFATLPRFLFIGIGLAFLATIYWLTRRFRQIALSLTEKGRD